MEIDKAGGRGVVSQCAFTRLTRELFKGGVFSLVNSLILVGWRP